MNDQNLNLEELLAKVQAINPLYTEVLSQVITDLADVKKSKSTLVGVASFCIKEHAEALKLERDGKRENKIF
jgi:hypothetical protein